MKSMLQNMAVMAVVAVAVLETVPNVKAQTLSNQFTYQGILDMNGVPFTGTADIRFTLWDALTFGTIQGTFDALGVSVNEGLVNVPIDMGSPTDATRYLQIAVRTPPGSGSYTTLSPRQRLTATPYALFAVRSRGIWASADGQNVGIGTSAPQARLHVRAPEAGILLGGESVGAANVAYMSFGDAFAARTGFVGDVSNSDSSVFLGSDAGDVVLNTAAGRAVNVKPNGNVGIGTSTPAAKLHVIDGDILAGAPNNEWLFHTRSSFGGDFLQITQTNNGVPSFNWGIVISDTGSVGINKTNPEETLDVNGDIEASVSASEAIVGYHTGTQFTGTGVRGVSLSTTGNNVGVKGQCNSPVGYDFNAEGAGINYGATSSRRWKHNIEVISSPLDKLEAIRGVYFDWDAEHGGHQDIGMIAEEVGAVLPEIVQYEANGIDATGMDYSKLTPLLVEAVKALRAETEAELANLQAAHDSLQAAHQAELDSLRAANDTLRRELEDLRRRVRRIGDQQATGD